MANFGQAKVMPQPGVYPGAHLQPGVYPSRQGDFPSQQQNSPLDQRQQTFDRQEMQNLNPATQLHTEQISQQTIDQADKMVIDLPGLYSDYLQKNKIFTAVNILFGIVSLALVGFRIAQVSQDSFLTSSFFYIVGYLLWILASVSASHTQREKQKHTSHSAFQAFALISAAFEVAAFHYRQQETIVKLDLIELVYDLVILAILFVVSKQYLDPKIYRIFLIQQQLESLPIENRQKYVRNDKF